MPAVLSIPDRDRVREARLAERQICDLRDLWDRSSIETICTFFGEHLENQRSVNGHDTGSSSFTTFVSSRNSLETIDRSLRCMFLLIFINCPLLSFQRLINAHLWAMKNVFQNEISNVTIWSVASSEHVVQWNTENCGEPKISLFATMSSQLECHHNRTKKDLENIFIFFSFPDAHGEHTIN